MKIHHIIQTINNHENLKLIKAKDFYLELLKKEICLNFNYENELIEKFMKIFPLEELLEFLLSNQKKTIKNRKVFCEKSNFDLILAFFRFGGIR